MNRDQRKSSPCLKPLLNVKVDELFLRWISLPAQNKLIENLREIKSSNVAKNEVTSNDFASSPLSQPSKDDSKPMVSPRRRSCSKNKLSSDKLETSRLSLGSSDTKHDLIIPSKRKNEKSLRVKIPKFHYPNGRPPANGVEHTFEEGISQIFANEKVKHLKLTQMGPVCVACGCPFYWKFPILLKAGGADSDAVSERQLISVWKSVISVNHDDASRFIFLLAKEGQRYLQFDDFLPLMRDIVDTHPGLSFLKEAPEFHTRYMNTVIARIFYTVNRSWTGKITANELRRSNFLPVLASLENEPDINLITDYFSYEHFYVIYCKFWELDQDHDLVIDRNDLARHSDGVLCSRLVDRVLSGAVTRWNDPATRIGCMSYIDFVWFLISEEDKTTNTSIEYLFRCMDLDGDGYISLYEMEYFYEEQMRKLELLDVEALPFDDCACQMLDMIKPAKKDCISLGDLKKSQMAGTFYDTFLNIEKYLEHEQKDPFANALLDDCEDGTNTPKLSDWEKYANDEYEILVAEEQANERKSDFDPDKSFNDDFSDHVLEDELKNLGIISEEPLLNSKFGGVSSPEPLVRSTSPASSSVHAM